MKHYFKVSYFGEEKPVKFYLDEEEKAEDILDAIIKFDRLITNNGKKIVNVRSEKTKSITYLGEHIEENRVKNNVISGIDLVKEDDSNE